MLSLCGMKNSKNPQGEQPPYTNHWKRYHNSLATERGKYCKARIERVLCICQSAFYRKLAKPQRFLTIAEKMAIARVYDLAETYLFPELAAEQEGIGYL
jgi:hypothetical protein